MSTPAPKFSRSGSTSLLGKLDAELPKQKISSATLAELQKQAAAAEVPLAEYVRIVLDVKAFGIDTLQRMHAERIRRVVGTGDEKG